MYLCPMVQNQTGAKQHTNIMLFIYSICFIFFLQLVSKTQGSVFLFSVHDVFVELDTLGHVIISRTNVTDWKYQASSGDNSEIYFHIKELRLLDRNGKHIKAYPLSTSNFRHFDVTNFESNQYTGVGANGRSMQVRQLGDVDGALKLSFYIFTESGTIHPNVAPQDVNFGDVRFDLEIHDMAFICNECSDVKGLEILLDVSGGPGAKLNTRHEEKDIDTITISKGAKLLLSDQISLDDSWDTMPEGYPELEAMDESVQITLRYPAFTSKAVYGLTIKPMKLGSNDENQIEQFSDKDSRQSRVAEIRDRNVANAHHILLWQYCITFAFYIFTVV